MNRFVIVGILLFLFLNIFSDGVMPDGDGTQQTPYLIANLDNLLWLSTNESSWESWFVQTADIDAAATVNWNDGAGFIPVGWWVNNMESLPFQGNYNGSFHSISNLYINRPYTDATGLFGYTHAASLSNIILLEMQITGDDYCACLNGYNCITNIELCSVTGDVYGDFGVGLMCGLSMYSCIYCSAAAGNVCGSLDTGGLIGLSYHSQAIEYCYSTGQVCGNEYTGGLTGYSTNSYIINCFSTCSVQGDSYSGGFTGYNSYTYLRDSYTAGEVEGNTITGAFAGYNDYTINNCIYNEEINSADPAVGYNNDGNISNLFALSTSEMQQEHSYTDIGWDFTGESANGNNDHWAIIPDLNNNYPCISNLIWTMTDSILTAFFFTDIEEPVINENVNFHNLSTGDITSCEWDFENDGIIDSYLFDPVWIYQNPGTYSVHLSVSNAQGETSDMLRENYIFIEHAGAIPPGSGSEDDPFLISSLSNLIWMSTNCDHWECYFLQTQDINAADSRYINSGAGLKPIGLDGGWFSGVYDGNGFAIDSLYINRPDNSCIALFSFAIDAVIKNLSLLNVDITGYWNVSSIVAEFFSDSCLQNCTATGRLYAESMFGALTGESGSTCISNCFYDINQLLVNDGQLIFIGALDSDMYADWIANEMYLDIHNYLDCNDGIFQINNVSDFFTMRGFVYDNQYSFQLNNDLDLTNWQQQYIPYFSGSFNGNGCQISNFSLIYNENFSTGLFGITSNASITNLSITNALVQNKLSAGGIAGILVNSSLYDCSAEAEVASSYYAGVLCGGVYGGSQILRCSATGSATAERIAGGLIGDTQQDITISQSTASCDVFATGFAGGLIGNIHTTTVSNCFSTGNVTVDNSSGGFAGMICDSTIDKCYSCACVNGDESCGAFAGSNESAVISNSIWNSDLSEIQQAIGDNNGSAVSLFPKNSQQMQSITTFTDMGWDFTGETINGTDNIWSIESGQNSGFPYLTNLIWTNSPQDELPSPNTHISVYPNPFNPSLNISFYSLLPQHTSLAIYNIKGQRIALLYDGICVKGNNYLRWDADNIAAGIYLLKIRTPAGGSVKKITLLK